METPRTRYVRKGNVHLAYQTLGAGPPLLLILGLMTHVEAMWDEPGLVRFVRRLASFSKVVVYDKRGSGLSDGRDGIPTMDELLDEIVAVLDAAEAPQAALVTANEASTIGLAFAAAHPDRCVALAVVNGSARLMWAEDYPIGTKWDTAVRYVQEGTVDYAEQPMGLDLVAPSKHGDEVFHAWSRSFQRSSGSPGAIAAMARFAGSADVRADLASIRCPVTVLHRRGDRFTSIAHARFIAEHVDGSRFVELEGADHVPWIGPGTDVLLDEIERLVTGAQPSGAHSERVLAAILFTDIVGSTEQLVHVGDRAWAETVDTHDLTVRTVVTRFSGRVIDTTGDGVFALFPTPTSAIDAARAIQGKLAEIGLEVRAGVHVGEVEIAGDAARGLAVHTAARIMSYGGARRIVASRTVRDLTAGGGFAFEPLGEVELKGLPFPMELFDVETSTRMGPDRR